MAEGPQGRAVQYIWYPVSKACIIIMFNRFVHLRTPKAECSVLVVVHYDCSNLQKHLPGCHGRCVANNRLRVRSPWAHV